MGIYKCVIQHAIVDLDAQLASGFSSDRVGLNANNCIIQTDVRRDGRGARSATNIQDPRI